MKFPVTIHGKVASASYEIRAGEALWHVPEEVPIAFVYNRRNYAVMMGTPNDFVDFGIGFSLTEEVIADIDEIQSLDINLSELGADFRFKISERALEKLDVSLRRRNLVGASSCGLCGLENAETLFKKLPIVSNSRIDINETAMMSAMASIENLQPLNKQTHSVHAAAWVSMEGEIGLIREDVGRHNALDKLLGSMAISNINPKEGFVLMSSRCSYEIVEKAARSGVVAIVSISGPTAFALRKAQEANMAIYSRSGVGVVRLL